MSNAARGVDGQVVARWIVLPYDGSPAARAALRHTAELVRVSSSQPAGVMLAVAGADPALLEPLLRSARAAVGADVVVEARLLAAGDPGGALRRLATELPGVTLAAPIGLRGEGAWYPQAVRAALRGWPRPAFAFYVRPARRRVRDWRWRPVRAALAPAAIRMHLSQIVARLLRWA